MAKNREAVTCNGRAAFYAAMWDDIRQCAMDCGWAVALHGSLASDMDIMAMPWVNDAVSFGMMVNKIDQLFDGENSFGGFITYNEKPHGRIVATIPIWADFYLDISTMDGVSVVRCVECRSLNMTGYDEDNAQITDPLLQSGFCEMWGKDTQICNFCSYGERREGE